MSLGPPPGATPTDQPSEGMAGLGPSQSPQGPTVDERRQGLMAQVREMQSQAITLSKADPAFEKFQKTINDALMGYLKQLASQVGSHGSPVGP